jgi:peptide/nickel transport system substrate-binding protein
MVREAAQYAGYDYTLDPQWTYNSPAEGELIRCCLARTLLSYDPGPSGHGLAIPRPDVADSLPQVSDDRLTWTFHLRSGLHYAPPFEALEVVAPDFIRAVLRGLTPPPPKVRAQLTKDYDPEAAKFTSAIGQLYLVDLIAGARDFVNGKTDSIAGLAAPDDHTLVVRVTRADADVAALFSTPTTAPIPPDPRRPNEPLGVAAGRDGYGIRMISTGPYMMEGADRIDFSSVPGPPASGYVPGKSITLVRNPSWDRATDPLRAAFVERLEIRLDLDSATAAAQVGPNGLDFVLDDNTPAGVVQQIQSGESRAGRLIPELTGFVYFIPMNLAVPPFDDPSVRRAVNWVVDRTALARMLGDPLTYAPFDRLMSDSVTGDLLADYDPFATAGGHGDLVKARAEMAKSPYDQNRDGRCDAAVCTRVILLTRATPVAYPKMAALLASELGQLGIVAKIEVEQQDSSHNAFYYRLSAPGSWGGIAIGPNWAPDYPSAGSNFLLQMYSTSAGTYLANFSLIGASPDKLRQNGYTVTSVPGIDREIDSCFSVPVGDQTRCWADLVQRVDQTITPWVPFAESQTVRTVSGHVVDFASDPSNQGYPALDWVAVNAGE